MSGYARMLVLAPLLLDCPVRIQHAAVRVVPRAQCQGPASERCARLSAVRCAMQPRACGRGAGPGL